MSAGPFPNDYSPGEVIMLTRLKARFRSYSLNSNPNMKGNSVQFSDNEFIPLGPIPLDELGLRLRI